MPLSPVSVSSGARQMIGGAKRRSRAEREAHFASPEESPLPSLQQLATLNRISFSGVCIPDPYAASLVDALKNRRGAVTLELLRCDISGESLGLIIRSLPEMHHLVELCIVCPLCEPSWLLEMAQGLSGNTSLEQLQLAARKTDGRHASALARGLRGNPSLERVAIELDTRTQVLSVLKHLLDPMPSADRPGTAHRAVPRLRELRLHADKKADAHRGDWFSGDACCLLTRLIEERALLERVELVPGVHAGKQKTMAKLVRAADRQMVDLPGGMKPGHAPPLEIAELRKRQHLFASPAALRAAAAALNFNATPDGLPLSADVMMVIASQLPVEGPPRASWLLRGLLSVNRAARTAADVSRSRTHAQRLVRQLTDRPNATKKGKKDISLEKRRATADALADMWRLCFAGIPLHAEDARRIERAAAGSDIWAQHRALVTEVAMELSRQHRETVRVLEREGSPRAAWARQVSAEVRHNGARLPATGMNELL